MQGREDKEYDTPTSVGTRRCLLATVSTRMYGGAKRKINQGKTREKRDPQAQNWFPLSKYGSPDV